MPDIVVTKFGHWAVEKKVERSANDVTTFVQAIRPHVPLDRQLLRIEVRHTPAKERELNDIPPFIAIAGSITMKPITAPGETLDDAVNELLYRLRVRDAKEAKQVA